MEPSTGKGRTPTQTSSFISLPSLNSSHQATPREGQRHHTAEDTPAMVVERAGGSPEPQSKGELLVTARTTTPLYIGRDDEEWVKMQNPEGWCYYYHTEHRVVIDSHQAPFEVPFTMGEDEEAFRFGTSFLRIYHETKLAHEHGTAMPVIDPEARQRYWKYMADHPSHHPLSWFSLRHACDEALLHLHWCSIEALIPGASPTAPFPLNLSKELHAVLRGLRDDSSPAPEYQAVLIMLVARILALKYEYQAIYSFWKGGRAQFQSSLKLQQRKLPAGLEALNITLSISMVFLCFGIPYRYLGYISEVDTVFLREEHWRLHIQRIVKEWTDFNLLATVLLSASVGFLALPDLNPAPHTAILISILSALGSITTGLYCVSVYQSQAPTPDKVDHSTALAAYHYKDHVLRHGRLRRKGIAIMLSLPMVFLLWSLISFTAGILIFNFVGPSTSMGTSYGVLFVGVFVLFAISMALYGLQYIWGGRAIRDMFQRVLPSYVLPSFVRKHPTEPLYA